MELKFKTVYGTAEPPQYDTTSSPTVSYISRNARKVHREMDGLEYDEWEFERATLTKDQFAIYMAAQTAAEANLATELAIAEIAESAEQTKLEIELALAEIAESLA